MNSKKFISIPGRIKKNVNLYDLARKFRSEDYEVVHEPNRLKINLLSQNYGGFFPFLSFHYVYFYNISVWEEVEIFSYENDSSFKLKCNIFFPIKWSLIFATCGTIAALVVLLFESSFYELLKLPFVFLFIFLCIFFNFLFLEVLHFLYLWIWLWFRINKFSKK